MRCADLFVMSDEALNFDWLSRIAAQLDHWIAMARLVLDGTSASFGKIASPVRHVRMV